ncbi:hypothetical protein THAOC_04740 [Thalassiosira oceanica]|uniref:Uncharacterized protein n=1 Tax=Thalassiosira oceanica TaxID=159749 RepID=K0T4G2_THAOC|nr:hypothetical protein THAOC_04740 [Thalassiosira oceanica]|eukprot:EJK73623.1 hypothetical protein THAOC_04740 [Thalassiosira oceanica]
MCRVERMVGPRPKAILFQTIESHTEGGRMGTYLNCLGVYFLSVSKPDIVNPVVSNSTWHIPRLGENTLSGQNFRQSLLKLTLSSLSVALRWTPSALVDTSQSLMPNFCEDRGQHPKPTMK